MATRGCTGRPEPVAPAGRDSLRTIATIAALAAGATAVGTGLAAGGSGSGGVTVSAEQLRIDQRISQAAVRRANANRDALAKMQDQAATPRPAGPAGPQGPAGAPGSDATVNGVAAGGDLAGTYPDPDDFAELRYLGPTSSPEAGPARP